MCNAHDEYLYVIQIFSELFKDKKTINDKRQDKTDISLRCARKIYFKKCKELICITHSFVVYLKAIVKIIKEVGCWQDIKKETEILVKNDNSNSNNNNGNSKY